MAMFERAEHVNIYGGSFAANASGPPKGGVKKLVTEAAPNAILNAGGRADEVRCFPGTREEVIGKLEEFMDDSSPDRKRMMWLSGPAGAGKSAIFQTVAERCSKQERQAANFFFFRGDSTRSNSKPLVATLVYQLQHFYPALNELLSDYLVEDPLICGAPVEKQFKQLISSPIQTIQQSTPIQERIVIIVDGLDECNNETRDQDQILVALHALAHANNSPFLILVSSRVEPQLVMSFNRLGSSVESIFLNDDYKPEKDIRLFVVAKFAEIKKDHHLAWTLGKKWPTTADIDAIIKKSSGQFIYAATVMRFIQFSSSSPALSLVMILEMPPSTNHNPLAHLDAVYSHIFSKVHNIHAVKLILFAKVCKPFQDHTSVSFLDVLRLAGYYDDVQVVSVFADLAAIIEVVPGQSGLLQFHHASLDDYLNNKSRSTIYYVTEHDIAAELASMCLKNIHYSNLIRIITVLLSYVRWPTPGLSKSLLDASTKYLSGKMWVPYLKGFIAEIERLYWENDKDQFKVLLQNWSHFVNLNARKSFIAHNPSASEYYKQYWLTEGSRGQEPLTPAPDSAPADVARSNIQVTPATVSPSAAIGIPVPDLSVQTYNNDVTGTAQQALVARLARTSSQVPYYDSDAHSYDATSGSEHNSPHPQHPTAAPSGNEEERYGGREYGDGPYKLSTIRVKFYYQDDIRSMSLTPNTPFSGFSNKVSAKFGKNFNDLTVKFKDEDGDKITIRDDSDYEHAIQTVWKSSKGKAEGLLKIWCHDRV